MKVLIVKNNFNKKLNWKKGIEWFEKNTPINLEIYEIDTDFNLSFRRVGNGTYSGVVASDFYNDLRKVVPEGKFHAVCLVYGNKAPGIRVSISEDETLYKDTDVIQVIKTDDGGKAFNHEMFHVFFHKLKRKGIKLHDPMDKAYVRGKVIAYYNNKDLDAKESNRTIAVDALKPHWNALETLSTPISVQSIISSISSVFKPKYEFFKESEIVGLKPELVSLLDKARKLAGIPFVITSGLRTEDKNEAVGGVKDSSHLRGEAVDLLADTPEKKHKILQALLTVGFKRIGIYPRHLHCDISKDKPQSIFVGK